jgi:hypothetical protein
MTTRKFADRPQDVENLKRGIYEASALSLATAAIISAIFKWSGYFKKYWWIPLGTNVAVTGVMAALYWNDLQQAPTTPELTGYRPIESLVELDRYG